jgi:SAM-dependent methyltransferase
MKKRPSDEMRSYWDERARMNAAFFVDTTVDYENPDMERFLETGRVVVDEALSPGIEPGAFGTAVEIGPGLGRICLALAQRFDRVIGIDISREMVDRARQLVTDERVSFVVGDGVSLHPVEPASADLVLTFTVFQHIPRISVIEGYIREAGRILRPGGVFVFQWNNTPGSRRWAVRRYLLAQLQRFGMKRDRHGRDLPAFLGSRVPLWRIKRAVETSGMELVRTEGLGGLFAWAWAVKR